MNGSLDWGEQLGLARTVRILETVGRAIREMKSAPEKIVMLEVAMVRLTKPDLDHSYRVARRAPHAPRARCAVSVERARADHASGASSDRRVGDRTRTGADVARTAPERRSRAHLRRAQAPAASPAASNDIERSPSSGSLTFEEVRERFSEHVVPRTSRSAQLLLRSARVESLEGLLLTIAVPSEEMRQNTELISQGLKGALEHEFKVSLTLTWTVDPTLTAASAPARRAPARPVVVDEEYIDVEETDESANVVVVDSAASHLITEMFPGAEEIS